MEEKNQNFAYIAIVAIVAVVAIIVIIIGSINKQGMTPKISTNTIEDNVGQAGYPVGLNDLKWKTCVNACTDAWNKAIKEAGDDFDKAQAATDEFFVCKSWCASMSNH